MVVILYKSFYLIKNNVNNYILSLILLCDNNQQNVVEYEVRYMGIKINIDRDGSSAPYKFEVKYDDGFSLNLSRNKVMNNGHSMSAEHEATFCINEEDIGGLYVFQNFKGLSPDRFENTIDELYRDTVIGHIADLENNPGVIENGTFNKPFYPLLESVSTLMDYYKSEQSRPVVKSHSGEVHETFEF